MSSSGWSCVAVVEPLAADDAQAGAVRPAERRDRLGQLDRLANRRSRGRARDGRSGARRRARRRRRAAAEPVVEVDRRAGTSSSSRIVDRRLDVAQAAAALGARAPSSRSASRQDPAVRAQRGGRGRRSASARRRSSPRSIVTPRDVVVAIGAGLVGEQAARRSRRAARRADRTDGHRRASAGRPRLVLPALVGDSVVVVGRPRSSARSSARRSSSSAMPFLMLCSVLTTSPSRPTRTPTAYSSAPRRIVVGVAVRRRRRSGGSRPRPPG